MVVLYTAWRLGSTIRTRARYRGDLGALPFLVGTVVAPDSGIGWSAWTSASAFTFVLGRVLQRQRSLIDELDAPARCSPSRR